MVKSWLLVLLALGVAGLGCGAEEIARTQIMLVVDSDLRVPTELDEIQMLADGPGGVAREATATLGEGQPSLPRSLGLVHQEGPLGPVHLRVVGRHAGVEVVAREAALEFRAGHTLVLAMHLVRSCIQVSCGEQQTCTELGCQTIDVNPTLLREWTGDEPRVFEELPGDGGMAVDPNPDGAVPAMDSGLEASDGGAEPGDAGHHDAGHVVTCDMLPELCNYTDDNCNGQVDEGYNFMTNVNHCGGCDQRCVGQTRKCCAGVCSKSCP